MSKQRGFYLVETTVFLVALLVFGSCAKVSLSCWHRGGTVVRNVFDWPTCVEPRKP